ncbi:MAG: hypothetical protein JWM93_2377 [Frankiales bacterium]|nr:hypothetical protein [Frankiales bacterium]
MANATNAATARDIEDLRAELVRLTDLVTATRASWVLNQPRRASITGAEADHIINAKQEAPGTGIAEPLPIPTWVIRSEMAATPMVPDDTALSPATVRCVAGCRMRVDR